MDMSEFEPWRQRLAEAFASKQGVEITKFSLEIGKNRDYMRRLIKDGTANPTPSLLIEICEKLDVSAAYIISGNEPSDAKDQIARRILEADSATLRRVSQVLDLLEADQKPE
jgi:transcriptional regulator with XRE-family HTH domain